MDRREILDSIPDVRDGLTRMERIVLRVLHEAGRERGGGPVPTTMLYGRVLEHMNMSEAELQGCLDRLGTA